MKRTQGDFSARTKKQVTIAEAKRRARAVRVGVVLGLLLLFVEVLKQSPGWFLFLVALTVLVAIMYAVMYWPIVAAVAGAYVLYKLARWLHRYRLEHVDPFPEGY